MRKPSWVLPRVRNPAGGVAVRRLARELGLSTVCESARCPNRGECLGEGTATFLILGGVCTRRCRFCAVGKGVPAPPDSGEPEAVAAAVARLGLDYAVVTSVTRDDLPDGGAAHFAAAIHAIRALAGDIPRDEDRGAVATRQPECPPLAKGDQGGFGARAPFPPLAGIRVEALVPDFAGAPQALETVLAAGPAVLNHNVETVPRLYPRVRPGADYRRSIDLLRRSRELAPGIPTKSGLMVGFGETRAELCAVFDDLAAAGVGALTIGQYLQPRRDNLPVERYLRPEEFDALAVAARAAGIARVAAGPLVRSSYRARELHAG